MHLLALGEAKFIEKVHSWVDNQLEMTPEISTISRIHSQEGIQKLWAKIWDKGSVWLQNTATPEPNTETFCRMGTLGLWPISLNTDGTQTGRQRIIHR